MQVSDLPMPRNSAEPNRADCGICFSLFVKVSGLSNLAHAVSISIRKYPATSGGQSLVEETALREVTTRKSALGGRSQIDVGDYPRMTYVLSVSTRNLDLAATLPPEVAIAVRLSLRGPGYSASQELAAIWIAEGIDSVVFRPATGFGRNVAVYLENAASR